MASAHTAPDYEQNLGNIAEIIRSRRPNCPPRETARHLLYYEQPGYTGLIGIDSGATRAILHQENDRYVISVSFDGDGIGERGPKIADFRNGRGMNKWLGTMNSYWSWLNPRYR